MKLKLCPICNLEFKQLIRHNRNVHKLTDSEFIARYLGLTGVPKCKICKINDCKCDTHHLCFSNYCDQCGGIGSNFRYQSKDDWKKIHPNQSEVSSRYLKELWKNEDYRKKMWNLGHTTMTSQFNDFEFVYRKYISSYKNITESTSSFVYLIENDEAIKVGFTYNLQHRLKMLGYPKVIDIIYFSDIKSGLRFEFDFHKSHKNLMIYNEYYPKSYLKIFKSIFTTFKQFMQ